MANITALARIGKLYKLPVVLATVNVATGINQPTIHQITDVLTDTKPIDRTSFNAWKEEDHRFTANGFDIRARISAITSLALSRSQSTV